MTTHTPDKNQLYYGDNLEVLRKYIKDESVDLCYIDPPFNSKRNYNQIYNNIGTEDRAQAQAFVDTWTWDDYAKAGFGEILGNEGGRFTPQLVDLINGLHLVLKKGSLLAYLVSMALRITEIHRVLRTSGSFYLHCDPTASHYLKLVLDAIFVAQGGDYKNEIVWPRTNAHNIASKYFARVQDTVFYYTKSDQYTWNPLFTDVSAQQLKRYSLDPATGRLVTGQDLTMTGNKKRNFTWRGTTPPPHRGWGFSEEQLEELWNKGLILTKKDGSPRLDGRKVFLDEKQGKPIGSVWNDIERIGNTSAERMGYPTQKPESLLERIISASSNEGDVILDAYCGCGTTVAVAEKMKRRWIGIDITYQSISLILRRLEGQYGLDALNNITLNGIPKDVASAEALAHKKDDRLRKEFEKWAVLTYSNNRAVINDKKGADKGIDGTAYFLVGKNENAKVVFQVKSGKVKRDDIATLNNDRIREGAELAVFITLKPPTKAMLDEVNAAGTYHYLLMAKHYPRVQIVTIADIIDHDKRLELPMSLEVLKKARKSTDNDPQTDEMFPDED
jgi:site-specific DNA-methyltransferase (adenine-specific)